MKGSFVEFPEIMGMALTMKACHGLFRISRFAYVARRNSVF